MHRARMDSSPCRQITHSLRMEFNGASGAGRHYAACFHFASGIHQYTTDLDGLSSLKEGFGDFMDGDVSDVFSHVLAAIDNVVRCVVECQGIGRIDLVAVIANEASCLL